MTHTIILCQYLNGSFVRPHDSTNKISNYVCQISMVCRIKLPKFTGRLQVYTGANIRLYRLINNCVLYQHNAKHQRHMLSHLGFVPFVFILWAYSTSFSASSIPMFSSTRPRTNSAGFSLPSPSGIPRKMRLYRLVCWTSCSICESSAWIERSVLFTSTANFCCSSPNFTCSLWSVLTRINIFSICENRTYNSVAVYFCKFELLSGRTRLYISAQNTCKRTE